MELMHPQRPCENCLTIDDLRPEDFRIGATDSNGHRERTQLSLHPLMLLQAQRVVSSGNFPYRSINELIRHALFRQLKLLERLAPLVNSVFSQVEAMQGVLAAAEANQDMQQTIKGIAAMVQTWVSDGQEFLARKTLFSFKANIDAMPDEDPWKSYYQETMEQQFGELMVAPRDAEPVSLATFMEMGDAV